MCGVKRKEKQTMSANTKRFSPFSRLKVTVENVEYDFDGMEADEIEQAKSDLPKKGTFDYAADELFDKGILTEDEETGIDWILDEDELEELISDRITSDTDFCHNGFNFRYSVSP